MSTRTQPGRVSVRRHVSPSARSANRPVVCERLESRELFSVSLDASGWTQVSPSSDTRTVFVSSSSGNDSNSGLSASSPVKSLSRAASLMRNGSPDWMLLDRGDTWNGSFPTWTRSGRSASEPMLIGAYGSGNRPMIATGAANGFVANTKNSVNDLILQDVEFYADQRDPNSKTFNASTESAKPTGLFLLGPSKNVTVEDCSFTYFKDNIVAQSVMGSVSDITIRRCTIANSYCTSDRSQGFYATDVDGITLEENTFDHNGWNQSISGAGDTGFNHNIYYSYSALNMTVRGNIIANASSHGVLARGGGVIQNNLFLRNAVGISYGLGNGATSTPGGVTGSITGNVFVDNKSIGSTPMGQGIEIGNIKPGAGLLVANNIFTQDSQQSKEAITITYADGTKNPGQTVGVNDVTIRNNITFGWRRGLGIDGRLVAGASGQTALNNLTIKNNDFQGAPNALVRHDNGANSQEHWSGNNYYSGAISSSNWFTLQGKSVSISGWLGKMDSAGANVNQKYTDPNRTAASYNATLGGAATLQAFMARADAQSESSWNTAYTADAVITYIRNGFAINNSAPASDPGSGSPGASGAASISGSVFNDANGSQKWDRTEAALSGWTVYLDLNNNGRMDSGETATTTDYQGNYIFKNLAAGNYIVRTTHPTGWAQTTPTSNYGQHITLSAGQAISGAQFGDRQI